MDHSASGRASAVLRVLADLAPSTEVRAQGLVVPTEWFRWLPIDAVRVFRPGPSIPTGESWVQGATNRWLANPTAADDKEVSIDRQFGERLAAVDQIRAAQRSLRVGWLFVAGRAEASNGRSRRVFHPLVTRPVRVQRPPALGRAVLVPAGDAEISELITDGVMHRKLESDIELGGGAFEGFFGVEPPAGLLPRLDRLQRYARSAAHAAGLPADSVVPASDGPDGLTRGDGLVIVAGVGVYAIHEVGESSRAASLRAWSSQPLDTWTAFHSLYLDPTGASIPTGDVDRAVESPFLLTHRQREAVATSRQEQITLISGAPGTGKSHTIAAIACDALARGQRVLVAAKSDATVDALLDLLDRAPDPTRWCSVRTSEAKRSPLAFRPDSCNR